MLSFETIYSILKKDYERCIDTGKATVIKVQVKTFYEQTDVNLEFNIPEKSNSTGCANDKMNELGISCNNRKEFNFEEFFNEVKEEIEFQNANRYAKDYGSYVMCEVVMEVFGTSNNIKRTFNFDERPVAKR